MNLFEMGNYVILIILSVGHAVIAFTSIKG